MEIKNKLKNLANYVLERPIKSAITFGLAALVSATALKDNVHFGSVNLYNCQENQYTFGIIPETKIIGNKTKGNIYTIGLIGASITLSDSVNHEGNISSYGLIAAGNNFGIDSKINADISSYGLITAGNNFGIDSKITGDINSFGIIAKNIDGYGLLKNSHLGLKDYKHVVKQEKQ